MFLYYSLLYNIHIYHIYRDFVWSPCDNLISFWVPEQNEIPSKIIIIRIPSREEVSTKSRHLVSDVSKNDITKFNTHVHDYQ